jgi:hypothetical protein
VLDLNEKPIVSTFGLFEFGTAGPNQPMGATTEALPLYF